MVTASECKKKAFIEHPLYPEYRIYGPYHQQIRGRWYVRMMFVSKDNENKSGYRSYLRFIVETTENKVYPNSAIFMLKDEFGENVYENIRLVDRTTMMKEAVEKRKLRGSSLFHTVDKEKVEEIFRNRNIRQQKEKGVDIGKKVAEQKVLKPKGPVTLASELKMMIEESRPWFENLGIKI